MLAGCAPHSNAVTGKGTPICRSGAQACSVTVVLNAAEMAELERQDPATEGNGGWQSLLIELQGKLDRHSGALPLSESDLERIPRYAFDYRNGGWENRLKKIFARTLGRTLGR
ncbi:MAG TPA: hypothetical protein VLC74_06540 [Rhizomicrobium sp.]|nr:hypothetical protein [Rhizomicrobium sp.]